MTTEGEGEGIMRGLERLRSAEWRGNGKACEGCNGSWIEVEDVMGEDLMGEVGGHALVGERGGRDKGRLGWTSREMMSEARKRAQEGRRGVQKSD